MTTEMTEARAREILGAIIDEHGLYADDNRKSVLWLSPRETAKLSGRFTAEELEAIAFWMRRNAT